MADNARKSNCILFRLQHQVLPASYIPIILVSTLVLQSGSISNSNVPISSVIARRQRYTVCVC